LDHFLKALSWVAIHLGTGEAMEDVSMTNNRPFACAILCRLLLRSLVEVMSIKLDGDCRPGYAEIREERLANPSRATRG